MGASRPKRNTAASGMRTALRWAALLLGLYVAMHLAAGGAIRLVTGRDASVAIAPGGSKSTYVAAKSTATSAGKESSASAPQVEPGRSVETVRGCKLGFPIDSDCTLE